MYASVISLSCTHPSCTYLSYASVEGYITEPPHYTGLTRHITPIFSSRELTKERLKIHQKSVLFFSTPLAKKNFRPIPRQIYRSLSTFSLCIHDTCQPICRCVSHLSAIFFVHHILRMLKNIISTPISNNLSSHPTIR